MIFRNKKNWINYGQHFLQKLSNNEELKEFISRIPNKDVVFISKVRKFDSHNNPFQVDFMYQVREKGFMGWMKSLLMHKKQLGSTYVRRDGDNNILFNDAKITCDDLFHFDITRNRVQEKNSIMGSGSERMNSSLRNAKNIIESLEALL